MSVADRAREMSRRPFQDAEPLDVRLVRRASEIEAELRIARGVANAARDCETRLAAYRRALDYAISALDELEKMR